MSNMTREKIGNSLNTHNVSNFSSLIQTNTRNVNEKQKKDTNIQYNIKKAKKLEGKEWSLTSYLIDLLLNTSSLKTRDISSGELSRILSVSPNRLRNLISRLTKKNIVKVISFNKGRDGTRTFEFIKETYDQLIEMKDKDSSIPRVKHEVVEEQVKIFTPKFSFNLEPLSNIGLTPNHIKQILNQAKITPEEIQDSINHFAFDLEHNDKAKTFKLSPLDVFIGMMRKGNYYNAPSNYESQKARNMRLSLEAKTKRQQAEKELEDRLKEIEWKEWSEGLTEDALMEFYVEQTPMASGIPERIQKTLKRKNALANAREYFEGEVWLQRKKEVFNENA